jgi:Family of unknown function (DUF6308)
VVEVRLHRIGLGPALVITDAEALVAHFLRHDASAQPGGYDDLAGDGERDRITRSDIVAINTTMRARSPHTAWDSLINDTRPLSWLAAIDPAWDLVAEPDERWQTSVRGPIESALTAATGPGRGISVGSKVLHLKRPAMFPVLDSLVLQQLGVTESVPVMRVVEHLRTEGARNMNELRAIQTAIAPRRRSLVRILDILLWASHPASGLGPSMVGWEHRLVRVAAEARSALKPLRDPGAPRPPMPPTDGGGSWITRRGRSFDDVWNCIHARGGMRVVSTRGTEYQVTAGESKGRRVLLGRPRSGTIYVHADCFGQDITCQGTRAGGIYNGSPSVWDC